MNDKNNEKIKKELLNIIVSCRVNILFGAGVNGSLFPAINDSNNLLINKIKENLENFNMDNNMSLEENISNYIFNNFSKKDEIIKNIKNVFSQLNETAISKINENNSFKSLKELLKRLIFLLENSNINEPSYKIINIFTLNYDSILEKALECLNVHFKVYDSDNILEDFKFIDTILSDYLKSTYLVKINVIKLHGSVNNTMIIPSSYKYDDILNSKHFELLSTFKRKILEENSLLVILGYGFMDEHINNIILNSYNSNSIIYDFQYLNRISEQKKKFVDTLLSKTNKNNKINTIYVNDINIREESRVDSTKYFHEIISKKENEND